MPVRLDAVRPPSARRNAPGRPLRRRARREPAPGRRIVRARPRRPRPDRPPPYRDARPADPGRGPRPSTSASAACTSRRSAVAGLPVDDRANQRMPEPEVASRRRAGRLRLRSRSASGPIPSCVAARPDQGRDPRSAPRPRRAASAGCPPGAGSAAAESSPRSGPRPRRHPAARTRRRALPASMPAALEQGERVAMSLGDDPIADGLVESPGSVGEERAGIGVGQRRHGQLGQPGQVVVVPGLADREDHHDALGGEPARDEAQDLRRCLVEPVDVVEQADQRLRSRRRPRAGSGPPARRGTDPAVRRSSRPKAVRSASRWGAGRRSSRVEERRAQLMEPGEGQLHLRLDARGAHDPAAGRVRQEVVEQRGLADAGLALARRGRRWSHRGRPRSMPARPRARPGGPATADSVSVVLGTDRTPSTVPVGDEAYSPGDQPVAPNAVNRGTRPVTRTGATDSAQATRCRASTPTWRGGRRCRSRSRLHASRRDRARVDPPIPRRDPRSGDRRSASARRRHALARGETVGDTTQGVRLSTMQALADYWLNRHDWRRRRGPVQRLSAVRHRDRRRRHPLRPRPFEARGCPAADRHPRLARLDHRAAQDHRTADRSDGHGASAADAFDLVIPSLPGHGFSGKPTETGWDPPRSPGRGPC